MYTYKWKMLYFITPSLSLLLPLLIHRAFAAIFICLMLALLFLPSFSPFTLFHLVSYSHSHFHPLAPLFARSLAQSLAHPNTNTLTAWLVYVPFTLHDVHFCMYSKCVSILQVSAHFHFYPYWEWSRRVLHTDANIITNLENGIFARPIYRHRQSHALHWKWAHTTLQHHI